MMIGLLSSSSPDVKEPVALASSGDETWKSGERGKCDDRDTVAVFSAGVAVSQAALYLLSRVGFPESHWWLAVRCLCLSFLLLFLPTVIRQVRRRSSSEEPVRWWYSDAILSCVGLFLLSVAGVAGSYSATNVAPALEILGLLLFSVTFGRWLTTGNFSKNILVIGCSQLMGVALAGAFWGWFLKGYSPLIYEGIMVGHNIFPDTFISASITSMIHTYGVPSTGLDGTPYCGHHWAVYWLFSGICDLLNTDPLRFIQLGFPVIFVPFLFSRLLIFSVDLREIVYGDRSTGLRNEWLSWLLLLTATIGFLPQEVAKGALSEGLGIVVVSLTHSVGLGFCFIILSLCTFLSRPYFSGTRQLTVSDRILVLVLPFFLLVLGMMKNSLMYSLLTILFYTFVRLRLWNRYEVTAALCLSMLMLFPVVRLTTNPGSGVSSFYPFVLFVSTVALSWKPFFFVFHYFWSWAFIVWQLKGRQIDSVGRLKKAFIDREILDVEVLAVACVVGSAPAFLFVIPGLSGTYFTQFQAWLALSMILARLPMCSANSSRSAPVSKSRLFVVSETRLSTLLVGALALCLLASVAVNAWTSVWRMILDNLSIRCSINAAIKGDPSCESLNDLIYRRLVSNAKKGDVPGIWKMLIYDSARIVVVSKDALKKSVNYDILTQLNRLAELPTARKRQSILYIPLDADIYWKLLPRCQAVPFVAPSITGVALLDGLPKADCDLRENPAINHYAVYALRSRNDAPQVKDPERLCMTARSKGFSSMATLDQGKGNSGSVRWYQCR
jgi:hypothetical protein